MRVLVLPGNLDQPACLTLFYARLAVPTAAGSVFPPSSELRPPGRMPGGVGLRVQLVSAGEFGVEAGVT